jgi:hypothetical protein
LPLKNTPQMLQPGIELATLALLHTGGAQGRQAGSGLAEVPVTHAVRDQLLDGSLWAAAAAAAACAG